MTVANANALFQGLVTPPSFNNRIHIKAGDPEDSLLRQARKKIRAAIRKAFGEFDSFRRVPDHGRRLLAGRQGSAAAALAKTISKVDVRFLPQGSHAYGTLIRPDQVGQEIDLDDGVYVPMPFLNGLPLFTSDGLFALIEGALASLVEAEGWSFERKDTCIRIALTGHDAHIDLPLYAVDDGEFQRLRVDFQKSFGHGLRATKDLSTFLDEGAGRTMRLKGSALWLAHRRDDWRQSDPKALGDWFLAAVDRLGPVVRRVCRYGKAWRDHTWADCEVSSLVLMVLAVEALEEFDDRPAENRDDVMVLYFARTLPEKLSTGHIVWREGEPPLDQDWSPEQRHAYVKEARAFADLMERALNLTGVPRLVVARLREAFGDRIPDAPNAVKNLPKEQTAAVLSTPASTVPAPRVGASVSG